MESVQTSIKTEQLVILAANALNQLFFEAKSDLAKSRFKELNKRKIVSLGDLALEDEVAVQLRLSLDTTEYIGKLNYQSFRKYIGAFLVQVKDRIDKQIKIALRNDETESRYLFELPVPMMEGNTLNVLMTGINTAVEGELELQLMFFDPEQFKAS